MPLVSGRVTTPSGQPAAGVYVYAHSADLRGRPDCHTDTTGTWRLELPAGTWTVRPVGHAAVPVEVGGAAVNTDPDAPRPDAWVGLTPEPVTPTEPREREGRAAPAVGRTTEAPPRQRRTEVAEPAPDGEPTGRRPRKPRDGGRLRDRRPVTEES